MSGHTPGPTTGDALSSVAVQLAVTNTRIGQVLDQLVEVRARVGAVERAVDELESTADRAAGSRAALATIGTAGVAVGGMLATAVSSVLG